MNDPSITHNPASSEIKCPDSQRVLWTGTRAVTYRRNRLRGFCAVMAGLWLLLAIPVYFLSPSTQLWFGTLIVSNIWAATGMLLGVHR